MVAETAWPDASTSVKLEELIELDRTASLKLTAIGVETSTLVALKDGLALITVGIVAAVAEAVVNDQLKGLAIV